jgi:hypothetical protein
MAQAREADMKWFAPILLFATLLLAGCPDSTPPAADAGAPAEVEADVDAAAEAALPPPMDEVGPMPDAVTDPDAPIPPPPEPQDGAVSIGPDATGVTAPTIAVGEPNPGAPGVVDRSCDTDADCAIKDVGSCCGYAPACVNKDSPTFPEQVQARCAKDGRMGICGFPAISGCKCTAGQCEGTGSDRNLIQ